MSSLLAKYLSSDIDWSKPENQEKNYKLPGEEEYKETKFGHSSVFNENPVIIQDVSSIMWIINTTRRSTTIRTSQYLIGSNVGYVSDLFLSKNFFSEINQMDLTKDIQEGYKFWKNHLDMHSSIILDDEKIGTIYLQYGLNELNDLKHSYILISSGILVISLIIAYILSSKLQRLISRPILLLVHTIKEVKDNKDYSIKVDKEINKDEIGTLIENFNEMLHEIYTRDEELKEHRRRP